MNLKPLVVSTLAVYGMAAHMSAYADIQVVRKAAPVIQGVKQDVVSVNQESTAIAPVQAVQQQATQQPQLIQQQQISYQVQQPTASNYRVLTVIPHNNHALGAPIPKQYSSNPVYLKRPPFYIQCFYATSQKYGVPVDLMMAIAQTESSFNHGVTGKLGYGADHGLMQINDYWVPKLLKRFGISLKDIYDPCTNIEIAGWILAHNFVQHGTTWRAVGAYNAVTEWKREVYIRKVANNLKRIQAGKL